MPILPFVFTLKSLALMRKDYNQAIRVRVFFFHSSSHSAANMKRQNEQTNRIEFGVAVDVNEHIFISQCSVHTFMRNVFTNGANAFDYLLYGYAEIREKRMPKCQQQELPPHNIGKETETETRWK